MKARLMSTCGLAAAFWMIPFATVNAQWGYPGGYGQFGWGGWGATTVEGSMAQGMGAFAAGAGFYNKQSAIADSINADTIMRWNEAMFQAQMEANRRHQRRVADAKERNLSLRSEIQKRLRDNPSQRDIFQGDALNVALDEISSPKLFAKALKRATAEIGGETIRIIPFRHAAAAITLSLHQLATGNLPAPLLRPEFAEDRAALKSLDEEIVQQIDDRDEPDPATVQKLLSVLYAFEAKAAATLTDPLERKQADRYLNALHGLIVMLKPPKIDDYLAGVDKRPKATLRELLEFMNAFNLRFGIATTVEQRQAYSRIYPMLVELRSQVSPSPEASTEPKLNAKAVEDFYSGMSAEDLQKAAPRPKP